MALVGEDLNDQLGQICGVKMVAFGVLGLLLDKTCPRRLCSILSHVEVSCDYPDPEYATRPGSVQGLHHR